MKMRPSPRVEFLEEKLLLSVAPSRPGRPVPAQVATPIGSVQLTGRVQGSYSVQTTDTTATLRLMGSGPVRPLGLTSLKATLGVTNLHPSAEFLDVTLGTGRGSVTVRIFAPGQDPKAFSPGNPTASLRYSIWGGTGAFSQASGTGLVDLTLDPRRPSFPRYGRLTMQFLPDR